MTLFPFFEDIEGKRFLMVGGGRVAAARLERLRLFTDQVTVVARESGIPGAVLREFRPSDLDGADYVIGASDDRELNRRVARLCRERGLPVNIVDDISLSTFVFPSVVRRGALTVGITTAGKSPAYARYLRRQIEAMLPQELEASLDELGDLRETLRHTVPDQRQRAELLKKRMAELLCEA